MCGLLDPKHLIYTGVKCEFIVIPLLVHCVYYDAASPELLRSTTVKTLYYSYGAGTGCLLVSLVSLINLRNLYPLY